MAAIKSLVGRELWMKNKTLKAVFTINMKETNIHKDGESIGKVSVKTSTAPNSMVINT
jgi:hypothetical protein